MHRGTFVLGGLCHNNRLAMRSLEKAVDAVAASTKTGPEARLPRID